MDFRDYKNFKNLNKKEPTMAKNITTATDSAHTPVSRVSFPAVFEMDEDQGGNAAYRLTLLIPKVLSTPEDKASMAALKKIYGEALAAGKKEFWKGKLPTGFIHPFKDGDERDPEKYPGYAGHWYIKAKTTLRQPVIVDSKVQPIPPERQEEFYPGCWCIAVVSAFAYNYLSAGVGFYLMMAQKVREGEPLGFAADPMAEFQPIDTPLADAEDMGGDLEDVDDMFGDTADSDSSDLPF